MIIDMKPLSMAEAKEFVNEEMNGFIKKFVRIKQDESLKLREDIEKLNIAKVKEQDITKIVDLLPEDASDLNKIFADASLDEDEINKILEVVKKY